MTVARTICLGFLAVISVGTILLMMPFSSSNGTWNDLIVALFTSTSAVCVTGLSVVDPGTYFSIISSGRRPARRSLLETSWGSIAPLGK